MCFLHGKRCPEPKFHVVSVENHVFARFLIIFKEKMVKGGVQHLSNACKIEEKCVSPGFFLSKILEKLTYVISVGLELVGFSSFS